MGLRGLDRPPGGRRRPVGLAGGWPARARAGRDHRPPVWLVAAVDPLRRPGRDEWDPGPGGRRRVPAHVVPAHRVVDDRGARVRVLRPVQRVGGLAQALRRPAGHAVPRCRDDRRAVGHHPRGHGGVRLPVPPARPGRHRRGPLRPRDRAAGRRQARRGPSPRHHHREDGRPEGPAGGWPPDRGRGLPDLGRGGRPAGRLGTRRRGARTGPAGAHPPARRAWRGPRPHALRPHPGHPARTRAG